MIIQSIALQVFKDFHSFEIFSLATPSSTNWYIYDGKKVDGPFAADALIRISSEKKPEQKLMVSRVGLDKWYPIGELDAVAPQTIAWQTDTNNQKETFSTEFERKMEALKRHQSIAKEPEKAGRQANLNAADPQTSNNDFAGHLAQETFASIQKMRPTLNQLSTNIQQTQHSIAKKQEQIYANVETMAANIHSSMQKGKSSPEFNYMMLKGRLRLGNFRSSFLNACLYYALSLGFYTFFWYRISIRELTWHIYNDFSRQIDGKDILSVLPFFNIVAFYKLGKLIEQAEMQNHYHQTSAKLALILGLIPPLAIFYLQRALNRHWLLHVKHA